MIAPLSPLVTVSGGNRMTVADIGVPQQPSVDRTEGTSLRLNYHVMPNMELRSITAWRTVSTDQWDNSGGAHRTVFLPNTSFSRYSLSFLNQRQFSQELQLVGSIPQVEYVVGGYYFNERAQEQAATPSSNKWNSDGTGYTINSETITGPVTSSNQGWAIGQQFLQRASEAYAKSYAAFGQLTYTPEWMGDRFHLTLGGRYTNAPPRHAVSGAGRSHQFTFNQGVSRFDPLIVAAYDVKPTVNVYAKYSTGYRAGGANDRSQTFNSFSGSRALVRNRGEDGSLRSSCPPEPCRLHDGPHRDADRFRQCRHQSVQSHVQSAYRGNPQRTGYVQDPRRRSGPDDQGDQPPLVQRLVRLYLYPRSRDAQPVPEQRDVSGLCGLHAAQRLRPQSITACR
jgi:hypothetical protein